MNWCTYLVLPPKGGQVSPLLSMPLFSSSSLASQVPLILSYLSSHPLPLHHRFRLCVRLDKAIGTLCSSERRIIKAMMMLIFIVMTTFYALGYLFSFSYFSCLWCDFLILWYCDYSLLPLCDNHFWLAKCADPKFWIYLFDLLF